VAIAMVVPFISELPHNYLTLPSGKLQSLVPVDLRKLSFLGINALFVARSDL
jgi:hypothetical protein